MKRKARWKPERVLRMVGVYVLAFTVLWVAIASGLQPETEVTPSIPFGLLPIAFMLAFAAVGMEVSEATTESRRDALFGLSAAIASFAILRLTRLI